MRSPVFFFAPFLLLLVAGCATRPAPSGPLKRHDYGARFEPAGQVLHIAGQSPDAFRDYAAALPPEHSPYGYMLYAGLKGDPQGFIDKHLGEYRRLFAPRAGMIQLGLSMTRDGNPEEAYEDAVARGEHDAHLRQLACALRELGLPVLLRIGYEFNGHWNGYEPADYIAAYRHVTRVMREEGAPVATVWCSVPLGQEPDPRLMEFYPGDDVVDWWGIDLFFPRDLAHPAVPDFLARAQAARKPVLIGESTPRSVGVHGGQASWDAWFALYFDLIHRSPGIKGFSYINWNWARYGRWSDWGDARIEKNDTVLALYRAELARPLYRHADSR